MPATTLGAPRFTAGDASAAFALWGCNCGPGALAAIAGMTLDEVRPIVEAAGFAGKRYMSPSMMEAALRTLRRPWKKLGTDWPFWGLVRVQWEGPWTEPGVPIRARYRYTHWIGAALSKRGQGIFDINCINNGTGWCSFEDWRDTIAPWLMAEVAPRGNGKWHITHGIELERP